MKTLSFFLALYLISFASATLAQDDPYKEKRGIGSTLYDTPVYDPHSKNYFELARLHDNESSGSKALPYPRALKYARRKKFKGVRGRLAIIRSKETQKFLIETFKPGSWGEIWIGLRMYCSGRKLFWVDGKLLNRRKDYTNWGKEWHYKDKYLPCRGRYKYAGVAIARSKGSRRWFAITPKHHVRFAFIEYPTGGR